MNLKRLGLQIESPLVHPGARNFRPPSWPPPPNWEPIVDSNGQGQCRYSDSSWPLDVWAGKPLKINFGDGKTLGSRIDQKNANLLRLCVTWFIWGPGGCRNAATLKSKYLLIKSIFVTCTQEGIVATDLNRFYSVIDKVATSLAPSSFDKTITVLHELLAAQEELGFHLLDRDSLARLAKQAPKHEPVQTPYIPTRIWTYQLTRLRECLEDYVKHQALVEDCFIFCLDAYARNFGSRKLAVCSKTDVNSSPFQNKKSTPSVEYHGNFELTANRFGLKNLLERWTGEFTSEKGEKQVSKLSQYLDLVSKASLAYILNFSLMRVEEGWNLRSDCLISEKDDVFGNVYMLAGETTKTDPDSDARWPVGKSAILAVEVARHISKLRMYCASERDDIGVTAEDLDNPYLFSYQYEPWSRGKHGLYSLRPKYASFQSVLDLFPRLLVAEQIAMTEEDVRIARLLTPGLDVEAFKVGSPWSFSWHQLRRTVAVNMHSSGLVDDSSIQISLKHQSRVMTQYYGRNHSRLALCEETRTLFLRTMYQEISRDLRQLPSPQFVSALGESRKEAIVTFIKEADAATLDKAAKRSEVGARRIRAGFCVNHRPCPYGGIEAIAHCLGGDYGKGCPDLLLDVTKEGNIKLYEKVVDDQLKIVHPDSPRHQSLRAEKRAIERFYEVVEAQNR